MSNILNKIFGFIFPNKCPFCNKVIFYDENCCNICLTQIEFPKDICPKCGKDNCMCLKTQLFYDKVFVPFYYDVGVSNAITKLKFNEHLAYAKPLAKFICQKVYIDKDFDSKNMDFIIPVPLYKKDYKKRGYNQTEILSKYISKILKICYNDKILFKTRKTRKQHNLNQKERKENLIDCFEVLQPEKVKGKNILLCDDVITTGSTLNECAKILKEFGAKQIIVLVVATTTIKKD